MHCMSDEYLAEDLKIEYHSKNRATPNTACKENIKSVPFPKSQTQRSGYSAFSSAGGSAALDMHSVSAYTVGMGGRRSP